MKNKPSQKERFIDYWLDTNYEKAAALIENLPANKIVEYGYYIAKHFGLKDLDFFNKLLN